MKMLFSIFLLGMCVLSAFAQIPKIEPGVSHELAVWRADHYSDVRYELSLTLEKMSPVLTGTIQIRVKVKPQPEPPGSAEKWYFRNEIILDWRRTQGSEKLSKISNVSLNGTAERLRSATGSADQAKTYGETDEHLIFRDGVVAGENVIKLDFTSPILTSGSAITRYIDKEDGSEYIYSLLSPSNASTAFPMFNQPDLKARFTLGISFPEDWRVVSNSLIKEGGGSISEPDFGHPEKSVTTSWMRFDDTKPISTYVLAFAAGPWQQMSTTIGNEDTTHWNDPDFHLNVYVRKSQAAKLQPHAAEIFKQTRETSKYFDQKSGWPKYDLVLIPELPSEMVQAAGITFIRESSIIGDK